MATEAYQAEPAQGAPQSDPRAVEGWVFDVKRYAVHDGPGIRTTIFFKGCSLSCIWCHNPESINPKPELAHYPSRCIGCGTCIDACPNGVHQLGMEGEHILHRDRCELCGACAASCYSEALVVIGQKRSVGDVLDVLREDRAFYTASGGGITLSGGEPFVQARFTAALLQGCQAEGYHTAVDTSGQVPWASIENALPFIDIVLYDLKHPDPAEHRLLTGAINDLILSNLRRLGETSVPIEIRIPVLPGINDGPGMLDAVGELLGPLKNVVAVRLLSYHSLAGSKYASIGRPNTMPDKEAPTVGHLRALVSQLQELIRPPVVIGE